MNFDINIREFKEEDVPQMIEIWNEVVKEGNAFPQLEELDPLSGLEFFSGQTNTSVAVDQDGTILGLYILHPNNIGRCGHIANSSYAVPSKLRGNRIGEKLVKDSLKRAKDNGFKILQFNAVVASNQVARKLYENLGFTELGRIPNGFKIDEDIYEDIYPYIFNLDEL